MLFICFVSTSLDRVMSGRGRRGRGRPRSSLDREALRADGWVIKQQGNGSTFISPENKK